MFFLVPVRKKVFYKTEGIAADFCRICRRASIVEVRQIRSQAGSDTFGLGQEKLAGRLVHCRTCHCEWALRPGSIQTSVDPKATVSLATLLAETYPGFSLVNEERIAQEAAITQDPFSLDLSTRFRLIAEPFFVLDNELRKPDKDSMYGADILFGIGFFGVLVLIMIALFMFTDSGVIAGCTVVAVAIGLGSLTVLMHAKSYHKYLRQFIYPRLAFCLAPLRPSADEIKLVVADIRAESQCASRLKLAEFLPFLEKWRRPTRAAAPHGGGR
jgi:hypothetical protein